MRTKAITLYQPYASLVSIGAKKMETRSWKTNYRGPLAIHAAKSKKYLDLGWKEPFFTALTSLQKVNEQGRVCLSWWLGYVVAVCELVDCCEVVEESPNYYHLESGNNPRNYVCLLKRDLLYHKADKEVYFGDYALGRYAWILENVKPLEKPVQAKGQQRLWNWELPADGEWIEYWEVTKP